MLPFFSPRLSKLPGWVSKDGAVNLEKVSVIGCFRNHRYETICGNLISCNNEFELRHTLALSVLKELKECAGRVFVDSEPEFCLPEVSFMSFRDQ